MGLLDDAIREHLELKRLRGADPGAVAREEQDALGPVDRRGPAEHVSQSDSEPDASVPDHEHSLSGSRADPIVDSAAVGQETVEINMEAELAGEADSEHESKANRPERAGPVAHTAHDKALTEESLEWEVPSDHTEEPGPGGAKTDGDSNADDPHDAAEPVEDVLEETPDFLRDTPEQERLWFEQRPPRDFDFNE
ncbi:MAG TPA: hypothetical protein VIJ39_06920 [Solirubrobacteraceae bacterium]